MKTCLTEMASERHGGHRYDPAEFGIDPNALRQRFSFYSDRFLGT
jgi:hypothetical protein